MTCDNAFQQDPDDRLDYGVDWASWLTENNNDEIATHQWLLSGGITNDGDDYDETFALLWVKAEGISSGTVCEAISRITTVGEREKDQTIYFRIEDN